MEPNVDRGMWSVVALLAAIVIGGVVLIAFPRISGKIANSMDETVNKAFKGETPSWVSNTEDKEESTELKSIQNKLLSNIYKPNSNENIIGDIKFEPGVALTHRGTSFFDKEDVGGQTKEKGWLVVKSTNISVNNISQIIDVKDKNKLNVVLYESLNGGKFYRGHGKIFGLNEKLEFVDVIVDEYDPINPTIDSFDISSYDYIVIHLPFSEEGNWTVSFDDVDQSRYIRERSENIIRDNDLNFIAHDSKYWSSYGGAKVTIQQNQVVKEWGTDKATRIQTTGGTHRTKYYLNPEGKGTFGNKKYIEYSSVYIKNNGPDDMFITNNQGSKNPKTTKTIKPGEIKLIEVFDYGLDDHHIQINFGRHDITGNLDFTVYSPYMTRLK